MNTHHLYLLAPGATEKEVKGFYGGILGLTEIEKPSSLSHIPVVWFDAKPIVLHVGYPKEGIVGGGHLALTVPDVEAANKHFTSHGCHIDNEVIPMGYPRFYLYDPWGNQFEILPETIS